jgi:1-acyl-sn-glycerol-3-phosphate acyltransferase
VAAPDLLRITLAKAAGSLITGFARLLTGVHPRWIGCQPESTQRIYFANHASHGDFVLIWACLPPRLRPGTRPVAGADYWNRSGLRRFIGSDVFKAVLIDREAETREADPIEIMHGALAAGHSLILFPEGTRNTTDERLLPFKSGIFHLASRQPGLELVPVWIDNLNRVLPKGEVVPLPLLCTVNFGAPLRLTPGETKVDFVARARNALLDLGDQCSPRHD